MGASTVLGKVMITPGGTYNILATYAPLTIVTHNGSSYLSLKTVQGIEPGNSPSWTSYWQLIASIGASITSISLTSSEGLVDTYTIVYGDNQTASFTITNGEQGIQGVRGTMTWFGTSITGTSTTPTAYQTGIDDAIYGDTYRYNGADPEQIGNLYTCTQGGDESTALWVYSYNIRGPAGAGNVSYVDGVLPNEDGNVVLSAVQFAAQTLTTEQQQQARTNIGAGTVLSVDSVQPGEDGNVVLSAVQFAAQTLTTEQQQQARTNIGAGTGDGTVLSVDDVQPGQDGNVALSAVQYAAQTLTTEQQQQARTNIGAGTVLSVDSVQPGEDGNVVLSAVQFAAQTLTTEQQQQARTNIGAGTPINDALATTTNPWSGSKIQSALAGKQAAITTATATLPASSWTGTGPYSQTVTVSGVTASNVVVVSPNTSDFLLWCQCQIRATTQGSGTLLFVAEIEPGENIGANIVLIEV